MNTRYNIHVNTNLPLRYGPHVASALAAQRPLVALESTVITHGLPAPDNTNLALNLERIITEAGATPATIGVLNGEIVVGLTNDEIMELASSDADKVSLWNLAAILASGTAAGTTVATTLYAAHIAGINVFATGGIGGVHDDPFDESADLPALARFPVLTVCAGPKSILNQSATMERLETFGVPVVGYRSNTLAGFIVQHTDIALPTRAESAAELAKMLAYQEHLQLSAGIVVSNPVSEGLAQNEFAELIAAAKEAAHERGIHGRAVTPFLLAHLNELSNGRTKAVNLRLLEENSRLAAEIAVAYARNRS